MLKPLLAFFIGILATFNALAQKPGTTILFIKATNGDPMIVESLEKADYYRLVIQNSPGDKSYDVKEFYKTGKIRFIGKTYANGAFTWSRASNILRFDGQCITYFPSGKKLAVTNYKNGEKDGMEYLFYPTGRVYCVLKQDRSTYFLDGLKWECYDEQGNEICQDGNGKWITYKKDFTRVDFEGPVKNGYMDGEWHGFGLVFEDTVKVVYQYKRNRIVSSVGYDKQGNAHAFKSEVERAEYKSGNVQFVTDLRRNIKLPKDTDGNKMSMDTAHVFFTVEKDGHLSNFRMYGEIDPKLKDAIFAGLAKINGWTPHRILGIPFRTEMVFPLNDVTARTGAHWVDYAEWGEKVLKDD